jgi:quercetin dioxygenase-like cupin family protein
MKLRLWALVLAVGVVAAWPIDGAPGADQAVINNSATMKFVNFPGFPTCATGAVESGDPMHGPSVILFKATAGCKVPWHWHTPNEHVMVISGSGKLELQDGKPVMIRAGSYALMPSHHVHQLTCVGPCTAFVSADGIFDIHYVDKNGKEIPPEQALGAPKMKPAVKKM